MRGVELSKLAGCYLGGLLFPGYLRLCIRGWDSPGIWFLREAKRKDQVPLVLRHPSPGEDQRPPGLLQRGPASRSSQPLSVHLVPGGRRLGLARMPFRTASSSLLPPLKVFCKLSSSFRYSPHIQSVPRSWPRTPGMLLASVPSPHMSPQPSLLDCWFPSF